MVIGVDAGATTTRCVVATVDGTVVGRGTAGGANRNSSGVEVSASIEAALTEALRRIDRATIAAGVLGAAGSSGAGREAFRAAAGRAWRSAGLTGELGTVTDLEVAFAAGTPEPDGVLLLAGTGALAARFAAGALEQRCDGYGWLLGDEGSAVWIAVRALRAVLAALDGRGEPTSLVDAAIAHFAAAGGTPEEKAGGTPGEKAVGTPAEKVVGMPGEKAGGTPGEKTGGVREEMAQALIAATFAMPPARLGGFAPAVSAAAEQDDAVAVRICATATGRLLHTFDHVGPPPGAVVVLAGSVLLTPGPVARQVRAGLLARTGAEPRTARDGAAGAAALAISRVTGAPVASVTHARLTR
ncbi:BadF/BadG/BcrA/BcrD ATPase family protein [Actinoplanes couchii]|uniref:N-acetylglucosamine kinase n=2 Tax=Actinoplanes couchii TaxID=403638 RepID=A0ABQ3XKI4_9ACTN|nr:N-acetylglucosamine kinase [Actinoplanes couchii]